MGLETAVLERITEFMNPPQIIRRGYVFRLRGNARAEARLRRFSGCCRKVWNLALAEQQARRERGEPYLNYVGMAKWFTAWRSDPATAYLSEAPVHALQNTLKSLDDAFQRLFKKQGGYPKFKRSGDPVGVRETDVSCFAVDQHNGRVKLPKVGWLRYRKSRDIDGTPKIVTVTRQLDGWSVSIMADLRVDSRIPEATAIGAADRGITNFLATDTGRLVAPLDAHKQSLHRLRRYQRSVARKIEAAKVAAGIPKDKPFPKGFKIQASNRLRKAQSRVARIHQKIARQRADFLHKLSAQIADTHAVFCIEDLKVRNMSASARGDAESPGRNVKAYPQGVSPPRVAPKALTRARKSGLNRSILDQGWAMWAGMVEYKMQWRGGRLIKVPAAYTSQRCASCGHTHADNRKSEKFKCLECGHEEHADINAAKNILAAGHAVLSGEQPGHAVVEDAVLSGRPVKRLPTEGLRRAA